MLVRLFIPVLLLILMSGCSFVDNFGIRKGKNANPAMVETPETGPWYCYGVPEDQSWDCANEPDDSKIKSVVPRPVEPAPAIAALPEPSPAEPVSETAMAVTPVNTPKPLPEPRAAAPATGDTPAERVMNTPGDYFAVQLIAMRDRSRVEAYAASNGINDPMIVPVENQDKRWHLLLLGTYETKADAEEARAEWESTRVLKVRPWIRRLKPLQDAIAANGL